MLHCYRAYSHLIILFLKKNFHFVLKKPLKLIKLGFTNKSSLKDKHLLLVKQDEQIACPHWKLGSKKASGKMSSSLLDWKFQQITHFTSDALLNSPILSALIEINEPFDSESC